MKMVCIKSTIICKIIVHLFVDFDPNEIDYELFNKLFDHFPARVLV